MNPTVVKFCWAAAAGAFLLSAIGCKQQDAAETLPVPVHTAMVQTIAVGNGANYSQIATYLASINLSQSTTWEYPLKTMARATGAP